MRSHLDILYLMIVRKGIYSLAVLKLCEENRKKNLPKSVNQSKGVLTPQHRCPNWNVNILNISSPNINLNWNAILKCQTEFWDVNVWPTERQKWTWLLRRGSNTLNKYILLSICVAWTLQTQSTANIFIESWSAQALSVLFIQWELMAPF
jgi:hypothetical protein